VSTSAVTLDFSKAQPISAPSGGVTLDFSKAQPIDKQPPLADQAHAEMSAKPAGAKQWLTDLESDLRYGGEQTVVGRALKAAGYQGAESLGGMEGTAGKTLVSPLTGPVFAAHGVAEAASGHPLRGAGEVLSGIGETSQIPMAFAAPETAEAAAPVVGKVGQTGLAVAKAAAKGADVVSFNRLSKVLEAMRSGAGDISDIWRGKSEVADATSTAAKVTRFTAADRQAATELLKDATSRVV
jgi:hypothetical protein